MREAGFHQQISLKRLKGAEYYKVNERNRGDLHFLKIFFYIKKNHNFFFSEYNYGWEYKHATVKPVNSINNMPKVKRYDYTIERYAICLHFQSQLFVYILINLQACAPSSTPIASAH